MFSDPIGGFRQNWCCECFDADVAPFDWRRFKKTNKVVVTYNGDKFCTMTGQMKSFDAIMLCGVLNKKFSEVNNPIEVPK